MSKLERDAAQAVDNYIIAKMYREQRMKLTVDTITDNQIFELRNAAADEGDTQLWRICEKALGNNDSSVSFSCTEARAYCVKILNVWR